jgi:hypothetical protein
MAGQQRGLRAAFVDQIADVGGQQADVVGLDAVRLRGQVVATRVGYQNSGKPCSRTTSGPSPAST